MSEMTGKDDRSGIQVIARAAAILRVLKDDTSGLSLGQIADRVHLPRSTVQRIAGALATERLVMSDPKGGGLRLGPELGSLAEAARFNIVERCRLLLSELAQATGETVDLSVMRGSTMIFLDQVPGTHRLRTVSSVGEVFPLTTTANGRACLAALDPDRAGKLAREEWDRRDIRVDFDRFASMLDKVRQTGLAYDLNEHTEGISAIGFAFADWSGDLHAISVPIPTTRFAQKQADVEKAIRTTAKHISQMMDPSFAP